MWELHLLHNNLHYKFCLLLILKDITAQIFITLKALSGYEYFFLENVPETWHDCYKS
jgi:hypothetical protein